MTGFASKRLMAVNRGVRKKDKPVKPVTQKK
jgi:hypothetical protein